MSRTKGNVREASVFRVSFNDVVVESQGMFDLDCILDGERTRGDRVGMGGFFAGCERFHGEAESSDGR